MQMRHIINLAKGSLNESEGVLHAAEMLQAQIATMSFDNPDDYTEIDAAMNTVIRILMTRRNPPQTKKFF